MTDPLADDNELQALYDAYARELPAKLEAIDGLWAQVAATGDAKEVRSLHRALHSLAGSGETFGYSRLGRQAMALESVVSQFLQDASRVQGALAGLAPSLEQLRQAALEPDPPGFDAVPEGVPAGVAQRSGEPALVYVVEDDAPLAQFLEHHLKQAGYSVRAFGDTRSFLDAVAVAAPAAAIIDVGLPEGDLAGTTAAFKVKSATAHRFPYLFMSARGDYDARVNAVRSGGEAYLTKPLDIIELINALDRLARPAPAEPYRVLVVDDSPEQARYLSHSLQEAHMETRAEADPKRVLQALAEFHPDLVLMDMYLSDSRGDELARVIRQMSQFSSLPIVYLSAETDLDRQLNAMSLGGDEFLTKPIRPAQLVKAVSTRAARHRELLAMITRDSLTGLVNHRQVLRQLEAEVARARRSKAPLSFAMIDVDHFKAVNDRYGHPVGDVVLKGLSRLLRQHLRQADVVGRYGGEEFAVVLPDTDAPTAKRVMDKLREEFSLAGHGVQGGDLRVTFSAGISSLTPSLKSADLVIAADQALYEAKRLGRNRVVVA